MEKLQKKREAAEVAIPEVYFDERDGSNWKSCVMDIEIIETDDFVVVGSKHERHSWMRGCGIEWEEWLRICVARKSDIVKKHYWMQEGLTTRHSYDARRDLKNLWGFSLIKVENLGNNVISVAWSNGNKLAQEERIDLLELEKTTPAY